MSQKIAPSPVFSSRQRKRRLGMSLLSYLSATEPAVLEDLVSDIYGRYSSDRATTIRRAMDTLRDKYGWDIRQDEEEYSLSMEHFALLRLWCVGPDRIRLDRLRRPVTPEELEGMRK